MGTRPANLLLLPPPPSPATFPTLKVAYGPPLTSVLKQLAFSSRKSSAGCVLDIALPLPHLFGQHDAARSSLFSKTQNIVAGVYKLICVIAAREDINVEDAEGVDARILLLAHPRRIKDAAWMTESESLDGVFGPVIDIQSLARCQRPWNDIYSVEAEEGEQILKQFLISQDAHMKIKKVKGGIVQISDQDSSSEASGQGRGSTLKHSSVAVGGTFDHLHIGHKLLLTMFAFVLQQGQATEDDERCYTVGITGDELLKAKKYADILESWEDRQASTSAFLTAILDFRTPADAHSDIKRQSGAGPNGHAVHMRLGSSLIIKLVQIEDPYGPTITEESISALVISAETRAGGKAVNDKRSEKDWPALEIFEVDVLDPEEVDSDDETQVARGDDKFESKISSTKIRQAISEKGQDRKKN